MSKDLALEQVEWDLHNAPEAFIPLEFTEEIKPDLFGLEVAKATEMVSGLSTTLAEREVLKNAYADVIDLEINAENLPVFKELRLKIVKNRTQGIEKWHKTNKAFYLAGGRFVDAVKNKEILINEEMESKLIEAEKFFEKLEKQKAKELNDARIEKIKPYLENSVNMTFTEFSDEDFDDLVFAKKTRFEANIEAIKLENIEAENERKILKLHNERSTILLPYWDFILEADKDRNWGGFDAETFQSCLKMYQDRKTAFDAESEKIRVENNRLKAEAEAKEKALAIERTKAKAKQDAIKLKAKQEREKAEKERKIEADKQAKIQAEKDAEIAKLKAIENTKLEAERLAQIEAEKLAKAPIKEQLNKWVESFELPECTVYNQTSIEINAKFEAFKKWSKNQILFL